MNSNENDHLPVYDGLVRERGDVVEEARVVSEQMQDQAWRALTGHDAVRPEARPS
jgi:hypothetical protein